MKYFLILILTGFIAITSVDMAFGICAVQNPDWPDAPCHDAGESLEERRQDWSHYYDLKGDDWMTAMKIQLMIALRDDVLNEWLDEQDDVAHWNVYTYYDQFENLDKYAGVFSPLKQLDYGFGLENIKCNENLVLVQKYDDSPACVTELTKQKLIEREWTRNIILTQSLFQDIKSNILGLGYSICEIQLDDDKITIDLHKFFKDSEPEKKIISQIPSVEYEIVYHEGYSDYFINTITSHQCEGLANED
ncbi:MAG: hypothetical protein ACW9W4_08625 [Candidatus Nitrosopumilus sp. bin_7KS]